MAGLYLHWPFCLNKCPYCDFFTTAPAGSLVDTYLAALLKELANSKFNEPITSIYFGGGTPSLLSPVQLEQILKAVYSKMKIVAQPEVTLEANPESLAQDKLYAYNQAGVNRLSLGVQSFAKPELTLLGRRHDQEAILRVISQAREAGFSNITLDLIFALPRQSLFEWRDNLAQAVATGVEHLSLYCLSWEPKTVFSRRREQGALAALSETEEHAMYLLAQKFLPPHGYHQYEISNYAQEGYHSRHNLLYWQNEKYLGLGASAASYDGVERRCNVSSVRRYIKMINESGHALQDSEILPRIQAMSETVFLALRTVDGLDKHLFLNRFQQDVTTVFGEIIKPLVRDGLLLETPDTLCIPVDKLVLADTISSEFL